MAEQVNIASLTIDVDDVIKESIKLKKQLDGLKQEQKELTKAGETSSEAFIQNEIQIKKLSKAYRDNQNFATALDKANEDLTKTMKVEGKSTQQLRDDRATLNQISKQIVGDTEEEIQLREKLNSVIDEQTDALKEQAPGYIEQKENIGGYTEGINAADFNLKSFIQSSEESGGASKLVSGGLKSAKAAMIQFTKSTLAFIATPVGLVLAAIAGAFLLIKNAMNRNEEATTKIKKAFAGFSGIVKGLQKVLEPLGKFLIDGLVKGFELVEKGIFKALEGIQRGLDFLGFDKAAANVGNFTEKVEQAATQSKELTEAELELARAQRIARKTQLEYQKDAEKLRQIRDDESKSTQERIKANEDLGKVLNEQLNVELEIAKQALNVANLRIKLNGETTDALDEQAEALTEIADIEERITGQQSEQLVNRVALQKEAAEIQKEIREKQAEEDRKAAEKATELARLSAAEFIDFEKQKLNIAKETNDLLIEDEKRKFKEFGEARKVQAAIDAENALQIIEAESLNTFEIEAKRLEQQRQLEISEAEKTGASVYLINEKYAARQKNLERAVTDAKLGGFKNVFDSYKDILGEQTKAGKAAAVASTLIATYQSAQSAYNSLAGIPIVGVGLGIAAAAAAIFAGLENVRQIKSTPTTFSKGDILKGKSHANGGIPFAIGGLAGFEAEGGESIINKRSTALFKPLLSEINAAGGGKRFAAGGIAGSTSSIPSSALIDYDLLASRISQANKNLPAPIVSVEEIDTVSSNINVVESLATA